MASRPKVSLIRRSTKLIPLTLLPEIVQGGGSNNSSDVIGSTLLTILEELVLNVFADEGENSAQHIGWYGKRHYGPIRREKIAQITM